MRIVFHVGMGKTGTSSLQRTLPTLKAELAAQKACYLGMWFEMIAPRFRGHEGLAAFATEPPEALTRHAATFADHCERLGAASGAEIFIHSNEGLFGYAGQLAPFFQALMARAEVRIIAYVRPPRDWLPSAFTQWNIYHKQQEGPIQPFRDRARQLIGQYDGVAAWIDRYGSDFEARRFDKAVDIVADFAAAIGITLPATETRILERREPAEVVLRALFNDRFETAVLPDRFNKVIFNPDRSEVPSLAEIIDLCFEFEEIDTIIAERRRTFETIESRTGLALIDAPAGDQPAPDHAAIRERLFEYVLAISMEQSLRIARLERRLAALEAGAREG